MTVVLAGVTEYLINLCTGLRKGKGLLFVLVIIRDGSESHNLITDTI